MNRVKIILALIAFLFLYTPTEGKIVLVPADSSTIQKGINGANAGDTVLVAMGIFSTATNGEIFPINMKSGVILLSEAGTENTWILANYDTTVINCLDADSTTIIKGFRISKGKSTKGGGIYCENSSVRIIDNEISYNKASYGAGIYCYGGAPIIQNNVFAHDTIVVVSASGYGAGIYSLECQAKIENNHIRDNILRIKDWYPAGYGAGIYCENSTIEIRDNLIEGNIIYGIYMNVYGGHGYGAGICLVQCESPIVDKNIIRKNSIGFTHWTSYAGGIYCTYITELKITYNVITENGLQGIYSDNSIASIVKNNTIASNADNGIDSYFSSMKIFNNIVTDNSNGGIKWGSGSTLEISYNDVWNNSGDNFLNCPSGVGDTTWGVNYSSTPCDSFYNIIRDPLFSTVPDSLYYLQDKSPCIDAGDPKSPKDPNNTIADIGAFYYHLPTDVREDGEPDLISNFELLQNYPNPFNPQTKIGYTLPEESQVKLVVYNVLGQKVRTLVDEIQTAGYREVVWDGKDEKGKDVASGIYFYKLKVENFAQTKKMLLVK